MKMKATLIKVIGVLMFTLFVVVLWCCTSHMAISSNNFKRIQIGMTQHQVEKIIGLPRWEVKPQNPRWIDPENLGNLFFFPKEWWGTEGVIRVWYLDGRVNQKDFTNHRCEIEPLSFVDKLPIFNRWLSNLSSIPPVPNGSLETRKT
jgi:hypothetical protein